MFSATRIESPTWRSSGAGEVYEPLSISIPSLRDWLEWIETFAKTRKRWPWYTKNTGTNSCWAEELSSRNRKTNRLLILLFAVWIEHKNFQPICALWPA